MYFLQIGFADVASGDSRLIGYGDKQESSLLADPQCLGRCPVRSYERWVIKIAHLYKQRTVPVEEDRLSGSVSDSYLSMAA
jgi:hypothetical protein